MAPLNPGAMLPIPFIRLEERDLENHTAMVIPFSPEQHENLQILALTFSSISVLSAFLAFYWFIQMKRSFRHHRIMLLIQSDMFKALWFFIYPIVVFTKGPQLSTSTFCQVNGCMISLSIEASDFAILMIAVHSSLYIFVQWLLPVREDCIRIVELPMCCGYSSQASQHLSLSSMAPTKRMNPKGLTIIYPSGPSGFVLLSVGYPGIPYLLPYLLSIRQFTSTSSTNSTDLPRARPAIRIYRMEMSKNPFDACE